MAGAIGIVPVSKSAWACTLPNLRRAAYAFSRARSTILEHVIIDNIQKPSHIVHIRIDTGIIKRTLNVLNGTVIVFLIHRPYKAVPIAMRAMGPKR